MWIGEDLNSITVAIANQQMASVRLKTQACWIVEITKLSLLALFAKGAEMGQGGSIEPLQATVELISDNQFFML